MAIPFGRQRRKDGLRRLVQGAAGSESEQNAGFQRGTPAWIRCGGAARRGGSRQQGATRGMRRAHLGACVDAPAALWGPGC